MALQKEEGQIQRTESLVQRSGVEGCNLPHWRWLQKLYWYLNPVPAEVSGSHWGKAKSAPGAGRGGRTREHLAPTKMEGQSMGKTRVQGQLQGMARRRPCHCSATWTGTGIKRSETSEKGGSCLMTLQLAQMHRRRCVRQQCPAGGRYLCWNLKCQSYLEIYYYQT